MMLEGAELAGCSSHAGLAGYTRECIYQINKGYGQVLQWSRKVDVVGGTLAPATRSMETPPEVADPEGFRQAVRKWQRSNGQRVDGIFGQNSWLAFLRKHQREIDDYHRLKTIANNYRRGTVLSMVGPECDGTGPPGGFVPGEGGDGNGNGAVAGKGYGKYIALGVVGIAGLAGLAYLLLKR
jgi:hypothetical protein